jgi:hypothetical protein
MYVIEEELNCILVNDFLHTTAPAFHWTVVQSFWQPRKLPSKSCKRGSCDADNNRQEA